MSLPALVVAQPDLEAWVWRNIGDTHGVTSFAYAGSQLDPAVLAAHSLQIDCRARRKGAARALAEHVRQLVAGLPDVPWADGVITYVQLTEFRWEPDDDGTPRYVTRFDFRVRPRWDATAAPDVAAATRSPRGNPAPPPSGDGIDSFWGNA